MRRWQRDLHGNTYPVERARRSPPLPAAVGRELIPADHELPTDQGPEVYRPLLIPMDNVSDAALSTDQRRRYKSHIRRVAQLPSRT